MQVLSSASLFKVVHWHNSCNISCAKMRVVFYASCMLVLYIRCFIAWNNSGLVSWVIWSFTSDGTYLWTQSGSLHWWWRWTQQALLFLPTHSTLPWCASLRLCPHSVVSPMHCQLFLPGCWLPASFGVDSFENILTCQNTLPPSLLVGEKHLDRECWTLGKRI